MIEYHFPAGHKRPMLITVDLQIPDAQHGSGLLGNIDHFRPLATQRVHDSLEHAAVRVSGPDDDNLFHRMLIPLYAKRESRKHGPPFALLIALVL